MGIHLWTICLASLLPSMVMAVYLWSWTYFLRWLYWQPIRRVSQQRALPNSSLNKCGYILGSHEPLYQIGIASSWAHCGQSPRHYWTPSSPSWLPSIPRLMSKWRSSIGSYSTYFACKTPSMRVFPMWKKIIINLSIARLVAIPFEWV